MNELNKHYDKFKGNNLPTPYWNEERQTLEYVHFSKVTSIKDFEEDKEQLEVNTSLVDALGEIANTGFYYSFTSKYVQTVRKNGKLVSNVVVGHNHAHSFEDVVKSLYNSPESFSISKDEQELYSKQELEYLRRVQKYLLFIGMKDIGCKKASKARYKNKIHSKYANAYIYKFDDESIKNIMAGKQNFRVLKWYPEYLGDKEYNEKAYQALIVDKDDNFKIFVEFTKRQVKKYKEVKDIYSNGNLKENDKLIIMYFKILKVFK